MRTPIADHIRAAAVADYLAGYTFMEAGERHGVAGSAVHKWAMAAGVKRRRLPRITSPDAYEGGWVREGLVMRPLEPVRRAG